MCGIFGWIPSPDFRRHDLPQVAGVLLQHLRHRGPNDRGYVLFDQNGTLIGDETMPHARHGSCLLGQTRLSIIDVTKAGHQPMATPDKRYYIVYNGEIYNYLELRTELRQEGYAFTTNTDTEVLLHAYVAWGSGCLEKINGMYAFAIYDTVEKRLFCARDCFGIKPFFWYAGKNGFAFASEIPALLHIPGIERRIDSQQAYEFLHFGLVEHSPSTMVQGVKRLSPGHWLTLDCNAANSDSHKIARYMTVKRYWSMPVDEPLQISFPDAAQAIREMFIKNVRLHLRSDVPLGVALSGGIDSSAVACTVRHVEPDADLHTFSYIADEERLSEEAWVNIAAKSCDSIQHKTKPSAENLLQDMDSLVLHLGEPFTSTSMYAQFTVMRLAHEHGVKVLLEGQGADELFGGYHGYLPERIHTLLIKGQTQEAMEFLLAAAQWPGREKIVSGLFSSLGIKVNTSAAQQSEEVSPLLLLKQEVLRERGVHLSMISTKNIPYTSQDKVRTRLAEEIASGLPGLMRHGDRNAMTFSVENRVPFCTRELATFALSLPEEFLVDNAGRSKSVFREAMRGIVPDVILDRRDKVGFDAPGRPWLQKLLPWMMRQIIEQESLFIDKKELIRIWKGITAEKIAFDWFYWRIISYLRWKAVLGMHEPG